MIRSTLMPVDLPAAFVGGKFCFVKTKRGFDMYF